MMPYRILQLSSGGAGGASGSLSMFATRLSGIVDKANAYRGDYVSAERVSGNTTINILNPATMVRHGANVYTDTECRFLGHVGDWTYAVFIQTSAGDGRVIRTNRTKPLDAASHNWSYTEPLTSGCICAGSLWAADPFTSRVMRLSLADLSNTANAPATGAYYLATDGTYVYGLANTGATTIVKIDPATNATTTPISLGATLGLITDFSIVGGEFVISSLGTVTRRNLTTGAVISTVTPGGDPRLGDGFGFLGIGSTIGQATHYRDLTNIIASITRTPYGVAGLYPSGESSLVSVTSTGTGSYNSDAWKFGTRRTKLLLGFSNNANDKTEDTETYTTTLYGTALTDVNGLTVNGGFARVNPVGAVLDMGTDDWTYDAVFTITALPTSLSAVQPTIFTHGDNNSARISANAYLFLTEATPGVWKVAARATNGDASTGFHSGDMTGPTVTTGVKYHAAIQRRGFTWELFFAVAGSEGDIYDPKNIISTYPNYGSSANRNAILTVGGGISAVGTNTVEPLLSLNGKISHVRAYRGAALFRKGDIGDEGLAPKGGPAITSRAFGNVVLQMDFEGSSTTGTLLPIDIKGRHAWTFAGNAQVSVTSPLMGGASLVLDGAGDWIQTTDNLSDFQFGTGDFYISALVKTSVAKQHIIIEYYTNTTSGANTWSFLLDVSGRLAFYKGGIGAAFVITAGSNLRDGNLHQVAVSRVGTTTRLFVDGGLAATTTDSADYSGTASLCAIGAQVNSRDGTYDFSGQIDEVRVMKGWGTATPPAFAYGPLPRA